MADAGNEDPEDGGVRPDPRAKLMQEIAAQMDAIEADLGDEYAIGNIVTIVEVIKPDSVGVRVRNNAPPWIGLGLVRFAGNSLKSKPD